MNTFKKICTWIVIVIIIGFVDALIGRITKHYFDHFIAYGLMALYIWEQIDD